MTICYKLTELDEITSEDLADYYEVHYANVDTFEWF